MSRFPTKKKQNFS